MTRSNAGGGIVNSGNLTLTNSTVSGNTTQFGDAGGILNNGTLTLTNSAVSGNSSENNGAGFQPGYADSDQQHH